MSALPQKRWTIEEYLIAERDSDIKHEYVDGQFYDMAGAGEPHNLIVASTMHALYPQARKKGCKVYASDMRIKTPSKLYAYPDLVFACGKPHIIEEMGNQTLLNPTLIIEVLSPTTERFDRTTKLHHYKTLDSLQEYILVSQYAPVIERFLRQDGEWLHYDSMGLDAKMSLLTLDYELLLKSVYEQVDWDEL